MLRPIAGATFELPLKPFLCYDVSGKLWHLANYRDFFPPIKKTYRSYWALPKGLSQYFIIHMKDFFRYTEILRRLFLPIIALSLA